MGTETYVLDIETNGFNPTVIHCVVCKNDRTNNVYVFRNGDRDAFVRLVSGHELVLHNGIGYDLPVLEKLWNYHHVGPVVDTLVLSRLNDPAQENGHSLKAWGERLGFPKGEHNDWTQWSQAMEDYCIRDVEVTHRVYQQMLRQNLDPKAVELEHQVAGIVKQQELNGWLFNEQDAVNLLSNLRTRMTDIEMEITNEWKPMAKFVKEFRPRFTKAGHVSRVGCSFVDDVSWLWTDQSFDGIDTGWTSVIRWVDFNLGSRKQIAERLSLRGWVPTEFTENGNPKVDESTLADVDIPEAKQILEYLMLQKRVGMLNNWLDNLKSDGRLHGRVNTNGAITGRMTHRDPNLAQVPSSKHDKEGNLIFGSAGGYGADMRSLFTVPSGYKLVGADAAQLELRMLAHYMNDGGYTNEILNGDIHTANQVAAGLPTRDQAKTFIYAFLYGAGDAKIGSIVGGSSSDGRVLKDRFLGKIGRASCRERV